MVHVEIDFRRNKIISITVSVVFHTLVLLLFFFMGLTHQLPLPSEYGIEIGMEGGGGGGGGNDGGGGESQFVGVASGESEPILTQHTDDPDAATVNTTNRQTVKPAKPQIAQTEPAQIHVDMPTVNPAALFPSKKGQGSGTGTNTGGPGSGGGSEGGNGTGIGPGDGSGIGPGSGGGTGGGDYKGNFFLQGRPVVVKEYPKAKNNLEGTVVVEFRADKNGNVVYAKASGKLSKIQNTQIWEECEKAAMKSKFKAKPDAEIEEKGTITYKFVIQ